MLLTVIYIIIIIHNTDFLSTDFHSISFHDADLYNTVIYIVYTQSSKF